MTGLNAIRDSLNVQVVDTGKPDLPEQGATVLDREGLSHIWSARYTDLDRFYPDLSVLVSPEEQHRAAGFKKTGDARRYMLRHGLLRAILEHYTEESPVKLSFIYGRSGKPDLDTKGKFPDIRFSLSCTDEMVCVGITRKSAIGLDIIRTQPRYSFPAIEHYLFEPGERRWIAQAVPDRRPFRFVRVWALKEAILKATGGDVRIMKEVDVSRIMTDTFLGGFYMVNTGERDQRFFIHESGYDPGHHCTLAVIPWTAGKADN
ncbi:MAG: 4'-phosphopantetheinyl transferase superfamily protein [Methanoregula sp.]|nr:4'-phosphopantetheinyl transferase superfamily protein [Methanoregula sp.]